MSKEYVKIEDNPNLVRDKESNAVLNTDLNALQKYKMKRNLDRQRDNEISELKKEISEIKSLLYQMVNKEGSK